MFFEKWPEKIKSLKIISIKNYNRVIIYTDSQYSINCITKWVNNWIKNDWKDKHNKLVKNKLENFFSNRLIIIDEIHNIRNSNDNSNKLVAQNFMFLLKNVSNIKVSLVISIIWNKLVNTKISLKYPFL